MTKLRIGYNCINQSIGRTYKSYRLATLESKDITKIKHVVDYNLITLGETIFWNTKNNFRLFRLSSNLIPFFSHELMQPLLGEILNRECVIDELYRISQMVKLTNTRITIHPSQMNVLSSTDPRILNRTLGEIELQARLLKMCGGDTLLLHLGGTYGDKERTKKVIMHNINSYVSDEVKSVLAFENDDKSYNSEDVVEVTQQLNLPWVYDFHHENIYGSEIDIIELLKKHPPTKYHICSGFGFQHVREHDAYVKLEYFNTFLQQLNDAGIIKADVMFEAKEKNLAVSKIMEPVGDGYWVPKK